MANLERNLEPGRHPQGTAIKEVLLNAETFEEAVAYLETVAMTSAGHFIVGGVKENEGIILSRDAHRTDRVERLADSERGFIAMTNADVWMVEDHRHITAVQAMEDVNRHFELSMELAKKVSCPVQFVNDGDGS